MTTLRAYSELLRMGNPILTTEEAALRLSASASGATQTLTRLQNEGLARRIFRGIWTLDPKIDPMIIPEHLTVPFPAYVSLQSALFFHGMISQIPQVIYVASLGPTRRVETPMGTFSIHRLAPGFFGGYRTAPDSGVKLATPEKALLDVFYLGSARSRLFSSLPELDLVKGFDRREARRWIERIGSPSRRTMVRDRLDRLLAQRTTVVPERRPRTS